MNALHYFLLFLTTTQAFHHLIPPDKETIYSWSADIEAGTHLPVPYASQYALQGKIHLQPHNNSVFVKLTDLTHRLYNGIVDHRHEYEAKNISLPQEVDDLENVFRITYSDDGLVEGIATQVKEKEFSRNIKKAIAAILQLNSTIIGKEYHRPESFVAKENSIYGHGSDVYSVYPQDQDRLEVHKLHNMVDQENIYSHFVTTTQGLSCDASKGKTVVHGSQKNYVLDKEEGSYVVKTITVVGSIVYYPFKARSDAQLISINQNFDLAEVIPIKENYHLDEEYFDKSLKYVPFDRKEQPILDETNGRRSIDYDKLLSMLKNMLDDIPQYMREDHINTQEPDQKRGQLVNRVQQILLKFSVQKLEELQTLLSDEALNTFYHILPLIGTEASTLYIKSLIVTKTIPEDLAIDLLQKIAAHIQPSVNLVQKLEDLIHLDSTFSWDLRKVAILNFGNIIYKSYVHQLESKSDDPCQPYEKYVDHYFWNLRNSTSFIEQITYLLGVGNMKLPNVARRLVPTFNGEWWSNQHLRYLAVCAAAPPIFFNFGPDTTIETLWPIFTNRDENVALRAISYYYIMSSRPNMSMLRNIFTYMLTEPDEELYRLHYTLSQTLMQSTDPCHQDSRLRLAQLMKFTPPPRRGVSEISFFGYQDEEFGFSAGVQKYYLKSKGFRIYAYYATSQLFYNYEEDWAVYWKIYDGRDTDPGLMRSLADIMTKSELDNFDFHIDAVIVRRGQIINTFAFDKNNVQKMVTTLQYFVVLLQSFEKNLLYINHERYNSYLIPTDLGIPAFWEYLMPEVHHNKFNVEFSKFDKNDINLHISNEYSAWIHYRHGLSFYNPIADVHQGINKYHAYDALVPLHFTVKMHFEDKKLQVNWEKSENPVRNIIGFRAHVTQFVFARDSDDYDKKVLSEFLPEGDNFQTVGHNKEFRHDYLLLDEDNLDTGYRWYLINYDSDIHAPFGVFKNRLMTFADPSSKYFHSPSQHWVLAWLHFHRDMVLLPRPGIYGFVARLEPSSKFNVTNIDFTWSMDLDVLSNSSFVPGFESRSHVEYEVRNHEEILKSWELRVWLKFSSGHNYGDLQMQLSRVLPKQKRYQICIQGHKNWTLNEVEGHWSVSVGESNDQECSNDTLIDITSIGERSYEQKDGRHKHSSCQHVAAYSDDNQRSMKCLFSLSTLRHYTYEITGTKVSSTLKQIFTNLGTDLRSLFHSYYTYKIEPIENITKDSFKVDVTFPLAAHEVNVGVATTEQTYEFSGVPLKYWDWFKVAPESTTYSLFFLEKYENGEINHCIVHSDYRYFNKKYISEIVPNEWTLYVANNLHSVYLKRIDNNIGVKITHGDHVFEVLPEGEANEYYLKLDDTIVLLKEYQEDWVHYRILTEDINKPVVIFLQQSGIILEYDVKCVIFRVAEIGTWSGQCYNTNI